jgi:hypothetical protein
LLAGHANANTTEVLDPSSTNHSTTNLITDGTSTSSTTLHSSSSSDLTTVPTTTTNAVKNDNSYTNNTTDSAEDALNKHQKKLALRSEAFNKAREKHMKEFQTKYTKQVRLLC